MILNLFKFHQFVMHTLCAEDNHAKSEGSLRFWDLKKQVAYTFR